MRNSSPFVYKYRRRPKWQMRAWQTSSILTDMARRTVAADTTTNGPPLPDECFHFLQQIDQLDKTNNATNVIDPHQWQVLCKMRRVKLEMEFRVRSLGAQVAEAESAVNGFVREINAKKAKAAGLEQRIVELIKQRVGEVDVAIHSLFKYNFLAARIYIESKCSDLYEAWHCRNSSNRSSVRL